MRLSLFAKIDNWFAPPPTPRKSAWLREWSFAYRGVHRLNVPENAPAAFCAAIEGGFGITLDVQRARDGIPVVFHQANLDELTDGKGPVEGLSSEQVSRIAFSGNGENILKLQSALDLIAGRVPVLIVLQITQERRLFALCLAVRRALEGYGGVYAIMSDDPRVCRWFATHSSFTVRGLMMKNSKSRSFWNIIRRRWMLWRCKPEFIAYNHYDLPSGFAAQQRRRGLPVLAWTVRSMQEREKAQEHADSMIAEGIALALPEKSGPLKSLESSA